MKDYKLNVNLTASNGGIVYSPLSVEDQLIPYMLLDQGKSPKVGDYSDFASQEYIHEQITGNKEQK